MKDVSSGKPTLLTFMGQDRGSKPKKDPLGSIQLFNAIAVQVALPHRRANGQQRFFFTQEDTDAIPG